MKRWWQTQRIDNSDRTSGAHEHCLRIRGLASKRQGQKERAVQRSKLQTVMLIEAALRISHGAGQRQSVAGAFTAAETAVGWQATDGHASPASAWKRWLQMNHKTQRTLQFAVWLGASVVSLRLKSKWMWTAGGER